MVAQAQEVGKLVSNAEIKAVVFDVDGTLLDTRELIRLGYVETLRHFGFAEAAELFEIRTLSKPIKESYRDMLGTALSEDVLADMLAHHEQLQNASTDKIVAYTGLGELLNDLQKRNITIGIFTSGSAWHVERNFSQVGYNAAKIFQAMVTSDDHVARKPSPAGLLLCLQRLGDISPTSAIMVGDHAVDMQVGQAAGVRATVGLLHGLGSRAELEGADANYIIPSLADLVAIIERIGYGSQNR